MPTLHRLVGLLYAALIGAGLWFLWPQASALLKGTWLFDLRIPAIIIYTIAGLWIAERCWVIIQRIFDKHHS